MKTYRSSSSEETKMFGHSVAGQVLARASAKNPKKNTGATVLALEGDLGAGKTTFVQGFFEGLGLKKRALSPTFIIMRRHALGRGTAKGGAHSFSNIFHIDAYRMKKAEDLEPLGLDEVFRDPKNLVLIEWPERAQSILPKNVIRLKFAYGKKENERNIIVAKGL